MTTGKLHVIVTAFHRPLHLKRLICDFLLQTNGSWQMYIVHDGPALKEIADIVNSFGDDRISLTITPKVNGHWGHPNRDMMLKKIKGDPENDYVLITNDDNQYTMNAVAVFRSCFDKNVGMILCDCLHSYTGWEIFRSEVKVGYIDMGSFIVRLDVAQAVGFSTFVETADGIYAEECSRECDARRLQVKPIRKILFIHN